MTASLFKNKVQLTIFCGLVVSGLSLAVGLFTSYQKGLALATVLGPILGTITAVMYFIKLFSAFFRKAAPDFWSDLCVLNQGIILVGIMMFESKGGAEFWGMLASASVIGLVFSLALYRSRAVNSHYILLIFHVLILTLPLLLELLLSAYLPYEYEKVVVLCIAAILIWLPLIYAATTIRASKVTDVIV